MWAYTPQKVRQVPRVKLMEKVSYVYLTRVTDLPYQDMYRLILVGFLSIASLYSYADYSQAALGETGSFRVTFSAGELFSEAQALEYRRHISMDTKVSWEIYVPETYDPNRPAGLITYISPTRSGMVNEYWKNVLREKNLIWIGANKSGNPQPLMTRAIYAILGTELMRGDYALDDRRLYVSGFSGGGRMASWMMSHFSHLYTGGLYLCGVNVWEDEVVGAKLDRMRERGHVFLTGTRDFNYEDTRNVLRFFREGGVRHTKFMAIDGMGHALPDSGALSQAIQYLDQISARQPNTEN